MTQKAKPLKPLKHAKDHSGSTVLHRRTRGASTFDPEAGLALTKTLSAGGVGKDTLTRTASLVVAFDYAGLDYEGGGALFEVGKSDRSAYLGITENGEIVFRAFSGNLARGSSTATSYVVGAAGMDLSEGTLVAEIDMNTTAVRVWFNGVAVEAFSYTRTGGSGSTWASRGSGSFARASTSTIPTGEINTGLVPEIVSGLRVYQNQTVNG